MLRFTTCFEFCGTSSPPRVFAGDFHIVLNIKYKFKPLHTERIHRPRLCDMNHLLEIRLI